MVFSSAHLILLLGALSGLLSYFFLGVKKSYIPSLIIICSCVISAFTIDSTLGITIAKTLLDPAPFTLVIYILIGQVITRSGLMSLLNNMITKNKLPETLKYVAFYGTVFLLSSFINNVIVVFVFIPIAINLSSRLQIPATRLLMPLSFIAILSGTSTIVGTSTTLVALSALSQLSLKTLSFFELLPVTLPIVITAILYVTLTSPILLNKKFTPETPVISPEISADQLYSMPATLLILCVAKILPSFGLSVHLSALLSLVITLALRKETFHTIVKTIEINLILLIMASLTLSATLFKFGLVDIAADFLIYPISALKIPESTIAFLLFLVIAFTTNFLHNSLTVMLFIPLSYAIASTLNLHSRELLYTTIIASNCGLFTKFGCQTNFMVSGVANYNSKDFFKVGIPLTIVCAAVHCLTATPSSLH